MMTIPTDEVIEAHPSAAPSFDFESFHRNMNQLKVQTAQVRLYCTVLYCTVLYCTVLYCTAT